MAVGRSRGPGRDEPRHLLDHLEELRRRLLISLAAFGVGLVVAFLGLDRMMPLLVPPGRPLVFLSPQEPLLTRCHLAMVGGAVLAAPVLFFQVWQFVAVGLRPEERAWVVWVVPVAAGLFVMGAGLAVVVVVPWTLQVLERFAGPGVTPMLRMTEYFGFVGSTALAFGVACELPLVLVLLSRLGVASAEQFARSRPYVVLGIIVVAAVLTPPDVVSQVVLAVPMWILFEVAVVVSRWVRPARRAPVG